jgi:hypothetical protein
MYVFLKLNRYKGHSGSGRSSQLPTENSYVFLFPGTILDCPDLDPDPKHSLPIGMSKKGFFSYPRSVPVKSEFI